MLMIIKVLAVCLFLLGSQVGRFLTEMQCLRGKLLLPCFDNKQRNGASRMDRQISDAGVNPLEATFPAMCVAGMSAKGTEYLNESLSQPRIARTSPAISGATSSRPGAKPRGSRTALYKLCMSSWAGRGISNSRSTMNISFRQ